MYPNNYLKSKKIYNKIIFATVKPLNFITFTHVMFHENSKKNKKKITLKYFFTIQNIHIKNNTLYNIIHIDPKSMSSATYSLHRIHNVLLVLRRGYSLRIQIRSHNFREIEYYIAGKSFEYNVRYERSDEFHEAVQFFSVCQKFQIDASRDPPQSWLVYILLLSCNSVQMLTVTICKNI